MNEPYSMRAPRGFAQDSRDGFVKHLPQSWQTRQNLQTYVSIVLTRQEAASHVLRHDGKGVGSINGKVVFHGFLHAQGTHDLNRMPHFFKMRQASVHLLRAQGTHDLNIMPHFFTFRQMSAEGRPQFNYSTTWLDWTASLLTLHLHHPAKWFVYFPPTKPKQS